MYRADRRFPAPPSSSSSPSPYVEDLGTRVRGRLQAKVAKRKEKIQRIKDVLSGKAHITSIEDLFRDEFITREVIDDGLNVLALAIETNCLPIIRKWLPAFSLGQIWEALATAVKHGRSEFYVPLIRELSIMGVSLEKAKEYIKHPQILKLFLRYEMLNSEVVSYLLTIPHLDPTVRKLFVDFKDYQDCISKSTVSTPFLSQRAEAAAKIVAEYPKAGLELAERYKLSHTESALAWCETAIKHGERRAYLVKANIAKILDQPYVAIPTLLSYIKEVRQENKSRSFSDFIEVLESILERKGLSEEKITPAWQTCARQTILEEMFSTDLKIEDIKYKKHADAIHPNLHALMLQLADVASTSPAERKTVATETIDDNTVIRDFLAIAASTPQFELASFVLHFLPQVKMPKALLLMQVLETAAMNGDKASLKTLRQIYQDGCGPIEKNANQQFFWDQYAVLETDDADEEAKDAVFQSLFYGVGTEQNKDMALDALEFCGSSPPPHIQELQPLSAEDKSVTPQKIKSTLLHISAAKRKGNIAACRATYSNLHVSIVKAEEQAFVEGMNHYDGWVGGEALTSALAKFTEAATTEHFKAAAQLRIASIHTLLVPKDYKRSMEACEKAYNSATHNIWYRRICIRGMEAVQWIPEVKGSAQAILRKWYEREADFIETPRLKLKYLNKAYELCDAKDATVRVQRRELAKKRLLTQLKMDGKAKLDFDYPDIAAEVCWNLYKENIKNPKRKPLLRNLEEIEKQVQDSKLDAPTQKKIHEYLAACYEIEARETESVSEKLKYLGLAKAQHLQCDEKRICLDLDYEVVRLRIESKQIATNGDAESAWKSIAEQKHAAAQWKIVEIKKTKSAPGVLIPEIKLAIEYALTAPHNLSVLASALEFIVQIYLSQREDNRRLIHLICRGLPEVVTQRNLALEELGIFKKIIRNMQKLSVHKEMVPALFSALDVDAKVDDPEFLQMAASYYEGLPDVCRALSYCVRVLRQSDQDRARGKTADADAREKIEMDRLTKLLVLAESKAEAKEEAASATSTASITPQMQVDAVLKDRSRKKAERDAEQEKAQRNKDLEYYRGLVKDGTIFKLVFSAKVNPAAEEVLYEEYKKGSAGPHYKAVLEGLIEVAADKVRNAKVASSPTAAQAICKQSYDRLVQIVSWTEELHVVDPLISCGRANRYLDLANACEKLAGYDPNYYEKMLHNMNKALEILASDKSFVKVPDSPVSDMTNKIVAKLKEYSESKESKEEKTSTSPSSEQKESLAAQACDYLALAEVRQIKNQFDSENNLVEPKRKRLRDIAEDKLPLAAKLAKQVYVSQNPVNLKDDELKTIFKFITQVEDFASVAQGAKNLFELYRKDAEGYFFKHTVRTLMLAFYVGDGAYLSKFTSSITQRRETAKYLSKIFELNKEKKPWQPTQILEAALADVRVTSAAEFGGLSDVIRMLQDISPKWHETIILKRKAPAMPEPPAVPVVAATTVGILAPVTTAVPPSPTAPPAPVDVPAAATAATTTKVTPPLASAPAEALVAAVSSPPPVAPPVTVASPAMLATAPLPLRPPATAPYPLPLTASGGASSSSGYARAYPTVFASPAEAKGKVKKRSNSFSFSGHEPDKDLRDYIQAPISLAPRGPSDA